MFIRLKVDDPFPCERLGVHLKGKFIVLVRKKSLSLRKVLRLDSNGVVWGCKVLSFYLFDEPRTCSCFSWGVSSTGKGIQRLNAWSCSSLGSSCAGYRC